MSIIYDALTKVQKSKRSEKLSLFDWLLFITILLLSLFIVFYFVSNKEKRSHHNMVTNNTTSSMQDKKTTIINPTQIDYTGNMIINGIFISGNDKFAIINNQTVHIGDMVENKKIVAIDYNAILLQDSLHIYVIKNKVNL